MGTLAAVSLVGIIMVSKYGQNAVALRTPASQIEISDLVQKIQQSINDPNICTSALIGAVATQPFVSSSPTPMPLPSSITGTTSGGSSILVAAWGMTLNGVSVATPAQSETLGIPPLQILGCPNCNYGVQPSPGPAGVQGLNCAQANLHVVTSKELPPSSPGGVTNTGVSPDRKTMGSLLDQHDIPITILTNSANVIQGCFGGSAKNICTVANAASASNLVVSSSCIDNGTTTATVTWVAPTASSVTLVCNGVPISVSAPATAAAGGVTISNPGVPTSTGTTTCVLTPINAAGIAGASVTSNAFTSQTTACAPSMVTISTSPASCVNTGAAFNLAWTDTDATSGATINVTGTDGFSYSGTTLNQAAQAMVAPAAVPAGGMITYSATDVMTGNSASPPAALTVMTAPVTPVLSMTNPASGTYALTSPPANISFSWTTTGISTATLTGSDGSSFVSTTGSANLPAPAVAGAYTYSASATGGCPGTPALTSNTVTLTVTASPSPPVSVSPSPSPSPSLSASCGSANGVATTTQPASNLCSDGSVPTVSSSGGNWTWTCGTNSCSALVGGSCGTTSICGSPTGCFVIHPFGTGCAASVVNGGLSYVFQGTQPDGASTCCCSGPAASMEFFARRCPSVPSQSKVAAKSSTYNGNCCCN